MIVEIIIADDKDLIYEGIATAHNSLILIFLQTAKRRQRPDLRRDCDGLEGANQEADLDDKDLIYEGIATLFYSWFFSLI